MRDKCVVKGICIFADHNPDNMELIFKDVKPDDYPLLINLAKRLGIQVQTEPQDEYDENFVKKINDSIQQSKDGKITIISTEDIWK